jgi:hypothetical protein
MMTLPLLATLALMIGLQLPVTPGSGQERFVGSSTDTLTGGLGEERHNGGPGNDSYKRVLETRIAGCKPKGTAEVDLSLLLHGTPGQVTVGSDLTYRARITNCGGTTTGLGVGVNYSFSAPVEFQLDASSPSCYSPEPRSVTCDISTVDPGETRKVQIVVRPLTAGTLINSAEVFWGPDPPENNRAREETRVRPAR